MSHFHFLFASSISVVPRFPRPFSLFPFCRFAASRVCPFLFRGVASFCFASFPVSLFPIPVPRFSFRRVHALSDTAWCGVGVVWVSSTRRNTTHRSRVSLVDTNPIRRVIIIAQPWRRDRRTHLSSSSSFSIFVFAFIFPFDFDFLSWRGGSPLPFLLHIAGVLFSFSVFGFRFPV